MHTACRACTNPLTIFQTKKFLNALRIDTSTGSKFFDATRHVTPILISLDKHADIDFRSVKEESDASRLRSLKNFLWDKCSFLC